MIVFLRKYQRTFDYIIISAVAYISFYTRETLKTKGFQPVAYNVISLLLVVGLAFLADWTKRYIFNSKFFDKRQKITGSWIERVDINGKLHVATFEINYDIVENKFFVEGNLFDPSKRLAISRWDSLSLDFIGKNTIYYVFHSEIRELNKMTFGTVRLTFLEIRGTVFSGQGFLIDSDPDTKVYNFEFERLTPELIKSLIGKKEVLLPSERYELIRKYSEMEREI